jgi:hypothetical protein
MAMQSLTIRFKYPKADLEPLYELEEQLAGALEEADAGDYDGHEMAINGKEGEMTMTGPDAHAIWEAVQPVLEAARFMRGADAELKFGEGESVETEELTVGS